MKAKLAHRPQSPTQAVQRRAAPAARAVSPSGQLRIIPGGLAAHSIAHRQEGARNDGDERATPRTMEKVDDFQKAGKAGQIKDQVAGNVTASKDAAARGMKDASAAHPDAGRVSAKPVTAMRPETPGPPAADVRAG